MCRKYSALHSSMTLALLGLGWEMWELKIMTGHSFDLKEITQRVTAELPDSPESYFDVIANFIHFEVSKGLNPSDFLMPRPRQFL